ncbi:MAG: hypothetical protein IPI63_10000 [Methanothrix sp.]|jgi:hypothetical protein|uniref:hypothetical protein n=1 Tax=Methanothrix sp. TaxID=90426 RepID=UPI001BD47BE0|nr:hypothetical protein [Methanothrix sp.]MBK7387017.1 hypothetical protein [Methanothrix sp.]
MRTLMLLIALFAIMGGAIAAVEYVKILKPANGAEFDAGDLITVRSLVSASNVGKLYSRCLVNDEPTGTSQFTLPPGEYTIRVEVADNIGFNNPTYDTVSITVN